MPIEISGCVAFCTEHDCTMVRARGRYTTQISLLLFSEPLESSGTIQLNITDHRPAMHGRPKDLQTTMQTGRQRQRRPLCQRSGGAEGFPIAASKAL